MMTSPETTTDRQLPGIRHVLEAAVLFGALGGLADASYIISQQHSLAANILLGIRFLDSAAILTALALVPWLLIVLIVLRQVARIRNWQLSLSLNVLYYAATLPAGALIALSFARLVVPVSNAGSEAKAVYYILKYAWIVVPLGWGFCAWLAGIRTKLDLPKIYGRFSAFAVAFTGYLLVVPRLQHQYLSDFNPAAGIPTLENLVISLGIFAIAIALIPLGSWIATMLARPMKGIWLVVAWLVVLAIPFIWTLIAGPPVAGSPPADVELAGRNANVILVSIDTLRPDDLGCCGSEIVATPNIDALAEMSAVFDNAVTPIPMTGPGHMCMLTGLQPDDKIGHGVKSNGIILPDGIPTLATILNDAGYRTAAVIGGSPLAREACGLQKGFNYYNDIFNDSLWARLVPRHTYSLTVSRVIRKVLSFGGVGAEWIKKPAGEVTEQTLEWLKDNQEQPFFMFVHYYDPHTPLNPPQPFDAMYSREARDPVRDFRDDHPVSPLEPGVEPRYTDDALANRRALYRGEVSYVDREFGRIMEWGDEHGLWENTLLIVTADHGEAFGPHYIGHINRLYEPIVRVPLIIRDPDVSLDVATGARINELVNISDIFATVLGFLEIGPPGGIGEVYSSVPGALPDWDHDLVGLIPDPEAEENDERLSRGWLFVPMLTHGEPTQSEVDVGRIYGFRFADSMLVYAPEAAPVLPEYQYFDLANDPGETIDYFHSFDFGTSVLLEAPELLATWAGVQGGQDTSFMDPLVRAQLRALGYAQ